MKRPPTKPPILAVRDLVVRYGDTLAVDGVDLEITEPGILALLGESGCGKTSLLRAIAGFEEAVSGTLSIAGRQVAGPGISVPPERRQVGMVFQEGALFPHLTVRENVAYGLANAADADSRVMAALELVGLAALPDRFPDELSGGQQQRVALARALAPAPRLVLLDEPFANLDAGLRQRVREEVRQILTAAGATAVLVTHDQEEAFSFAERVAVMKAGKVLQVGTPDEIYHCPASLEVATFVGDGQLLECTVEAGRVRSPLGAAPTVATPAVGEGPGLLLVRCEDLAMTAAALDESLTLDRSRAAGNGAAGGAAGTLTQRRFFGHDMLDEVRLDSGETLQVRSLSSTGLPLGARVRLSLRDKRFQVFPPNATGQAP